MGQQDRPDQINIYMERNLSSTTLNVYIMKDTPKGRFIGKVVWSEEDVRFVHGNLEPSFVIQESIRANKDEQNWFIRSLMDSLKHIGALKKQPEMKMLEGKLEAKEEHLRDMRSLVFNEKVVVENAISKN